MGVEADELKRDQLTPLTGGSDGVRFGDPAWAANAGAAIIAVGGDNPGLSALNAIAPEIFNLIIIPEAPMTSDQGMAIYAAAAAFAQQHLAMLLCDHPKDYDSPARIREWKIAETLGTNLGRNAALCFPKIVRADPLASNRPRTLPASGSIAGVMARTDVKRGVWKAPAGIEASLTGVFPSVTLTDPEQGQLNKRGINCLRAFPNAGTVHWGARTLAGADQLASEWKYVPVRRTALLIERSLKDALTWVVFEPNDEALWAQVRLNVGAFMQSLFVQGAFEGRTPRDAYLVRCDAETTTQQDVNSGIINILVGFAPLKPAEFVVLRLKQLAGRLAA
jgi:phage tail sheath protein FI